MTISCSSWRFSANSKARFCFWRSANFASRASLGKYSFLKTLAGHCLLLSRCGYRVVLSILLHFEQALLKRSSSVFCLTAVTNCKQLRNENELLVVIIISEINVWLTSRISKFLSRKIQMGKWTPLIRGTFHRWFLDTSWHSRNIGDYFPIVQMMKML